MKAAAPIKLLTALFIFGLGLATGLVAQTSSDSPNRTEQKRKCSSDCQTYTLFAYCQTWT